ncbi:emp24/gp25L/p24 family protein [Pelomyxa schiedti]|nr:emp24/gp25L/p24 family protein [Pelomyxa schiedti]
MRTRVGAGATPSRWFFAAVAALVVGGCGVVSAFSFSISPHSTDCFKEWSKAGEDVTVIYQVLSGGQMDVDFEVLDPLGEVVYSQHRTTSENTGFTTDKEGYYQFCWGNKMSTLTPKTLSAMIIVGDDIPHADFAGAATASDLTPLDLAVEMLAQGVMDIRTDQKHMHMRDIAHRNVSESTNQRVLYWFIFEAVLIVALALWQVLSLRKIFEQKRIV